MLLLAAREEEEAEEPTSRASKWLQREPLDRARQVLTEFRTIAEEAAAAREQTPA